MNNQLHKSHTDKMILGVCGGVAEYFEIDSSIVRILWAITSLFVGVGILLYLIAAIILPYEDAETWDGTEEKKKSMMRNYEQRKVVGIILIVCGLFILMRNFSFFIDLDYVWSAVLIALGVGIVFKGRERKDKDEE